MLDDGSRMSREAHVRFCEGPGVQLPRSTHPYIWTAEGWLYAAAVLDLYSRRIVGWSMHDSMTSQLVADALMMAVWRRGKPATLLHHSDQGRPVHQRALPGVAQRARHYLQHEPRRRGLGQLSDGKLLQFIED